ncbi:hypothetical protein GX51_06795 [Blastomyces parvus]|uniref:chitin deacetylase n=1 Tax=Blastomyces parvus TaxID=2060905 RepID=A0A2B7WPN6_9EURO|nr:hypothetical protein GX51_06795 [Blastomyces parvus]
MPSMLTTAIITVAVAIPPALLYLIYKPPTSLIHYFQRRWPDILWLAPTKDQNKLIALTIDDGPSPYTAEILQVLKANDATATFFLIGSNIADVDVDRDTGADTNTNTNTSQNNAAESQTETLHALLHAGNELANHAMHDEPSWRLSDTVLTTQIKTVERKIQHVYNAAYPSKTTTPTTAPRPPKYFRPGSGFFTTRMRRLLAALEYRLVLGSVYPHDAQIPSPRVNARHILSLARPGAIIIVHDGRRWTAPMLRVVLPELRGRGYRVVSVSELVRGGGGGGG